MSRLSAFVSNATMCPLNVVADRQSGGTVAGHGHCCCKDGMIIDGYELPVIFRHHVFCCFQQRPPGHPKGSCGTSGGGPLWERLGAAIEGRRLQRVAMAGTGCLGFCNVGPLMVVYPEGVWYRPRTPEDIDEIVQSHFVEGRPVDRLVVILER